MAFARPRLTRRRFIALGLTAGAAGVLVAWVEWLLRSRDCAQAAAETIDRAGWGAAEPDLNATGEHGRYDAVTNPEGWLIYSQPLAQVLNTIIVHHSASSLGDGPREIQRLHMQLNGFADIGYHFAIDYNGRVYAGRDLTVRGAHTRGYNFGTVGVVLLGNFETVLPSLPQVEALKTTARCLAAEYGITHLAGHHDFQPEETVCLPASI